MIQSLLHSRRLLQVALPWTGWFSNLERKSQGWLRLASASTICSQFLCACMFCSAHTFLCAIIDLREFFWERPEETPRSKIRNEWGLLGFQTQKKRRMDQKTTGVGKIPRVRKMPPWKKAGQEKHFVVKGAVP
mmetsp:Transcript_20963/g.33556  ORF Transcript_20963/g.33556 Transcript_20963/m.33556 type:complete len:133 (-) Transcript_20963:96-494(-)